MSRYHAPTGHSASRSDTTTTNLRPHGARHISYPASLSSSPDSTLSRYCSTLATKNIDHNIDVPPHKQFFNPFKSQDSFQTSGSVSGTSRIPTQSSPTLVARDERGSRMLHSPTYTERTFASSSATAVERMETSSRRHPSGSSHRSLQSRPPSASRSYLIPDSGCLSPMTPTATSARGSLVRDHAGAVIPGDAKRKTSFGYGAARVDKSRKQGLLEARDGGRVPDGR